MAVTPLALVEVAGIELGLGALVGGGLVTILVVLLLLYFLGGEELLLEGGLELLD